MTRIITNEDGQPWFAVEVFQSPLTPLRGGAIDAAVSTAEGIAEVGDIVAKACSDIFTSMKAGLSGFMPDEVELEFGVQLSGEASIPLITKASGQATFGIRVCWKPTDNEQGGN